MSDIYLTCLIVVIFLAGAVNGYTYRFYLEEKKHKDGKP